MGFGCRIWRCGTLSRSPLSAAWHVAAHLPKLRDIPPADEAGPGLAILLGMKLNGFATWLSLVLVAACDEVTSIPADAGADAAPYDGDPNSCEPALLGSPVKVTFDPHLYPSTWIEADGELIGVGPLAADGGYEITRIQANGEQRDERWTVQADATVDSQLSAAAVGGALAIASLGIATAPDGNQRRECLLSVLRLTDQSVVRANIRLNGPTESATIINEVQSCKLTAVSSGFVVAWQQYTTPEGATGLFAQRFALDGTPRGERVALLENALDKEADLALTSDGENALIAFRGGKESVTTLAFVEPDAARTQPLDGVDTPILRFVPAHDGFMLQTATNLYHLNRSGRVLHGPHALTFSTLVAPLGTGYVTVEPNEYLVARTLDSALAKTSVPLGISDDRGASAITLLPWSTSAALLLYGEAESIKLAKLGCGATPGSLGPKACPKVADFQPLDPECGEGDVCHVVLRFDYLTLGVRGWSVSSEPPRSTDASQAVQAAQDVFDANSEYLVNPLDVSGPVAGLYYVSHSPGDFGGFALVSEGSGAVVAAGGVVWAGRGGYWVPNAWRPASDILCGDAQQTPTEQVVEGETCTGDGPNGTTASQAMSLALSTNLAQAIAAQGAFTARTYLYTPSVGACAPDVAEWLVILSRK